MSVDADEAYRLISAGLAFPADYVPPAPQQPNRRATLADIPIEEILNG